MSILMKINRNRIIRGIARNCSPFLVTGYGSQSAYSQGQIDKAIEETGCNNNYSDYAYAMFGKEEDFSSMSSENYSELCDEIGDVFLNANSDFTAQDFISYSSSNDSAFGDGCGGDGGDGD